MFKLFFFTLKLLQFIDKKMGRDGTSSLVF